MNRIILLLVVILPACGIFQTQDNDAQESGLLTSFNAKFPALNWTPGDTLALPAFQFGMSPEEMGLDSTTQIGTGPLETLITPRLLEIADYDSSYDFYPLGKLRFGSSKQAYLLGIYKNYHTFHTQMFLFDSLENTFSHTHSLVYLIGGGGFLSLRKAWMVDLNMDQAPDLVYRKDELYTSPDPAHSYYMDTLRAEVWDGSRFSNFQLPDVSDFKAAFALEE